jgi:hypothetical protein
MLKGVQSAWRITSTVAAEDCHCRIISSPLAPYEGTGEVNVTQVNLYARFCSDPETKSQSFVLISQPAESSTAIVSNFFVLGFNQVVTMSVLALFVLAFQDSVEQQGQGMV